jgi:mannonate dehydratase
MGVRHVVSTPSQGGSGRDQYDAAMRKHKEEWAAAGMEVAVYETMTPAPAANIRRGSAEREEELKNWNAAVEAMGKVGIPVLCYNLGQGGRRTGSVKVRDGAISTAHDYEASKKLPPARETYTEDQLWKALGWLIERVIPACEKAKVKMGYHPNDAAVSPFLGSAQIMVSPAACRRLFAMAESAYNGVSFCQGDFRSMRYAPGEDIYSVATEFAERNPGYAMPGHVHALRYAKGLMQALNIAYE